MMQLLPRDMGWIEVICGSMFSGKTQELIRRLRLASLARQKVQVFSSTLDVRYGKNHIISHDRAKIPSKMVRSMHELAKNIKPEVQVIGIDEVQFLKGDVFKLCQDLANHGKRVIVAGLDQDYLGRPFEVVAHLLAVAEFVTKNLAICVVCGNPANHSQRLSPSKKRIEVGSGDKYEARCRNCFRPG